MSFAGGAGGRCRERLLFVRPFLARAVEHTTREGSGDCSSFLPAMPRAANDRNAQPDGIDRENLGSGDVRLHRRGFRIGGAVLASRLSESGRNRVLVLEYGGRDDSMIIQMPAACAIPMTKERYDWGFMTEPEPGLNGRRIHQARGKVIGGTSSINGMCYVRGHADDFDSWEALGNKGWGYRHCLPYFRRAESSAFGGDDYRGSDGPLHTCNGNNMANPLYRALVEAGVEAGYSRSDDVNGWRQEGFGRMDMTVKDGRRWSTASAYLKPAMARANLTVILHALTRNVLMDGRRAIGVEYEQDGRVERALANREVILSAGPMNSPKLLMLSGIGEPTQLKEHGIEVVHELPGVGTNLQDHLEVWCQISCTQPVTLNSKLNAISKLLIGMRWFLFRDGLGATNHFEANGYIRSHAGASAPDIQYHFIPVAMGFDGSSKFAGHGYQATSVDEAQEPRPRLVAFRAARRHATYPL